MIVKRKLFAKKPRMSAYEYVDKYLKNAAEKAGYSYEMPNRKHKETSKFNEFTNYHDVKTNEVLGTATTNDRGVITNHKQMPHESFDEFTRRVSKRSGNVDKILNDAENAKKLRLERLRKAEKLKHQRVVGKRLKNLGKGALIVGGVGTALGTGAYLTKKHFDKKKSEKKD